MHTQLTVAPRSPAAQPRTRAGGVTSRCTASIARNGLALRLFLTIYQLVGIRKEALALAAIQHWNDVTGALFAGAPYQVVSDPRERLLAYLDFRAHVVSGEAPEFTCLLGTLVQETFATHPALRAACGEGIEAHAQTLVPTIEAARKQYAPGAEWSAADLARHTQVVLQCAFVLAKAMNNPQIVLDEITHLRRYVEHLLPTPEERKTCLTL